jgi:prevent-host-death family protein
MHRLGTFHVKTHLAQLLARVEAGETITITRRGVDVAQLVPMEKGDADSATAAAGELRALRNQLRQAGTRVRQKEIRGWIDEGRP